MVQRARRGGGLRFVWCFWLLIVCKLADPSVFVPVPVIVMSVMMVMMVMVMGLWPRSLCCAFLKSQRCILTEVFIFQGRERAVSTILSAVSSLNGLFHIREIQDGERQAEVMHEAAASGNRAKTRSLQCFLHRDPTRARFGRALSRFGAHRAKTHSCLQKMFFSGSQTSSLALRPAQAIARLQRV